MAKGYDADSIMAEQLYQEMGLKEKVVHLWGYYKNFVYAFIILILIFVMGYVMRPIPGPEPNLRIKFINTSIPQDTEGSNYVEKDYEEYLGEENDCIMLLTKSKLSKKEETKSGMNMESMMVEVVTGNVDLFIYDEFAMKKLCTAGWVLDLNTCLDYELLQKVEECLVYCEDLEGKTVPMAIDITNTNYVKEAGMGKDKVYVSFVANTQYVERAREFVTYMVSK